MNTIALKIYSIQLRLVNVVAVAAMIVFGMGSPATANNICGTPSVVTLYAGQNTDAGTVELSNDQTTLYVTFTLTSGWEMSESHVHVASAIEGIPQTRSGNPKIGNFDFKREYDPERSSDVFEIPLDSIDGFTNCGDQIVVAAHAAVQLRHDGEVVQAETAWGNGPGFTGKSWATFMEYNVRCCDVRPVGDCDEQNRTQTQGGWGSGANGNNPGVYRDNNFDSAFPDGLVIGEEPGFSATFSTSFAIETFLPAGGPPADLGLDYNDPTTTSAGVLAGQITALTLSVGFDDYDPAFGASDVSLGGMVIVDTESDCYGWSVDQVIAEGNCVLSGASCTLTASQISDCADTINNAFVDGDKISGDVCAAL